MSTDRGDIAFTLTADDGKLSQALSGVSQKAQEAFGGMQAAVGRLQTPFAGLAVAIGGIAVAFAGLRAAVSTTLQMTEAAMDMSRALGLSTNASRAMAMALEDIGAEQGEFEGAAKGLVRQLKENEEGMNALGLRTRDAAGNLLPLNQLVTDAIQVLGQYKEGTDRAMVSTQLFGRGLDASSKLMLLTGQTVAEATQTMQDLGLEVGENAVNAWKLFDEQADRAKFGLDGIKKAVGDALLPVLTTLTEILNAVLPAAIIVVRGALGGLAGAFLYVRNGVVVLWETIHAMIVTVTEPLRGLAEALFKAVTGDFSGAVTAIKSIGTNIANTWGSAMDTMVESSEKTRNQIRSIFGADTVAGSGGGLGPGSKSAPAKQDKAKAAPKEVEQSMMQAFETALEQRKLAYERENQMREFAKSQELAYWQELLTRKDLTEKDRAAIVLRSARLEVQIARDAAKAQGEITTLRNEDRLKAEQDYITQLQAIAQQERDLGLITQQELLAQKQQFNAQRMAAELEFLNQKLELAKLDPDKNLVLLEQLEMQKQEIYRKYAQSNAQIAREIQAEVNAPMKSMIDIISSSLSSLSKTMLTDWKNIGKALRAVFKDIGLGIIEETITKPLKAKLAAWLTEKIFGKAKTFGRLGELSAEAGAGGVASMAGAPFPLNLSAPAFGASMAALALSFAPAASAAGGFDIPSGLNPITQLHQREMVLPEAQADVIRSMAGGGASGGGSVQVTIQAFDSKSLESYLKDNGQALGNAIAQARRRGFAT
jgi:hypothetical protein